MGVKEGYGIEGVAKKVMWWQEGSRVKEKLLRK